MVAKQRGRMTTSPSTALATSVAPDDDACSRTYFARTTASSYPDELYDDIPCNPFCNVSTGTPIPVVEGSTTEGIDFVLGTGLSGSVAGTVREAGTVMGLAAVRVTAYDDLGRPQVSTLTAGDGSDFLTSPPSPLRRSGSASSSTAATASSTTSRDGTSTSCR